MRIEVTMIAFAAALLLNGDAPPGRGPRRRN